MYLLLQQERAKLVKITDFDISKVMLEESQIAVTVAGTTAYMAPEVFASQGYSVAADSMEGNISIFFAEYRKVATAIPFHP